jgi:hypothetical protein
VAALPILLSTVFERSGNSRDDALDTDAGDDLQNVLGEVFDSIHDQISAVKTMWTGIMGFSADGLLWVGELPETTASDSQCSQLQGHQ